MLPSTLSTVRNTLMKRNKLSDPQLNSLISTLQLYKKDELIYPGVLIRKLNIAMRVAYEILEDIKKMNIITTNYELYCHNCSKFTGYVYQTINQIPEYVDCEICGKELSPFEDCITVYKVIVNE